MAFVIGFDSSLDVDESTIHSGGMVLVTAADGAVLSLEIVWKSCLEVVAG